MAGISEVVLWSAREHGPIEHPDGCVKGSHVLNDVEAADQGT